MKIRVFKAEDIRRSISMAEAIEVVKDAFCQLSSRRAESPVRTALTLKGQGEAALIMPAYLGDTMALGTKMVTVFPNNPRRGLPATQALVVLFDAANGSPLAIFEGTHLTRLRTGAATGAATQVFSRIEASTLAMFGAGGQALAQVEGVLAARKIKRIKIFDIFRERAEALMAALRDRPWCGQVEILQASSPGEALPEADVVVTATSSSKPVFQGSLLARGSHINAIGSFRADMQEVDEETIGRARIFVDSVQACLEEAGDLIIPLHKGLIQRADILAEIGEVISGEKAGRKSSEEITYFKSVGNAVQDISVAQAVWQRAIGKGLGQEVEL
jgi:ornithine cyclodeaminase